MSTVRNLIRSSAMRTINTVIAAAIAFFMMPFLVHALGERWYGVWVVIGSLVGNYYLLDLGVTAAVTRFVAKYVAVGDDDGVNSVVNTALFMYSIASGVIVVITVILGLAAQRFVPQTVDLTVVQIVILITGLQFAAEFPFKAFAGIISSYIRQDLLILSRLFITVISTTLIVIFVGRGAGIVALAAITFFCEQISSCIYFLIARRLFRPLRISRSFVRRGMVRELLGYSSWAFVIQIANQFRFRLDAMIIGAFVSAAAVTHYAVGLRLVEYFIDLVFKATNFLTPVFTGYYVRGEMHEIRTKLLLLTRINVILCTFGGGLLIIVARPFIVRWMGPDFADSYPVFVVLLLAMMAEAAGCYADNLFFAMAKHRYLALINLAEAAINIPLSLLLVHRFGIVGVAAGIATPLILFRLFVIPVAIARFTGLSLTRYYAALARPTAATAAYVAFWWLLVRGWLPGASYGTLALICLAAAPLYVAGIPFVAFNADERRYLVGLARGLIKRGA